MGPTVGGPYLWLDIWRIIAAACGLLIATAFLRIAVLRWWQGGLPVGQVLTWVSHGAFALGTSLFALLRLGDPPLSMALLTLASIGIVAGVLGVSEELGVPPWVARLMAYRIGHRESPGLRRR